MQQGHRSSTYWGPSGQVLLDVGPADIKGRPNITSLSVAGLFAGIGGIELGLHAAGHVTELLCEIDPPAQSVLRHRFPNVEIACDIRELRALPDADIIAAGFPCQD